eukprot:1157000-Pelagomonas_calceolata.AAC.7
MFHFSVAPCTVVLLLIHILHSRVAAHSHFALKHCCSFTSSNHALLLTHILHTTLRIPAALGVHPNAHSCSILPCIYQQHWAYTLTHTLCSILSRVHPAALAIHPNTHPVQHTVSFTPAD